MHERLPACNFNATITWGQPQICVPISLDICLGKFVAHIYNVPQGA
jgi:hypothetical protein